MTLLQRVAEFIDEQKAAALPEEVAEQARRALANWTAVALHAAKTSEGQIFLEAAKALGPGTASLADGTRVIAAEAALVNGALAHVDDFDDTHLATVTHPSTPVVAAALAACGGDTDWKAFLKAIAIGTEINIRIAELLNPGHYDAGWHITASVGAIGSAAAVSYLWDLPVDQTVHACALAAMQPVGLRAAFGTMAKSYQVGCSAQNGWKSSYYARFGTTGPKDALEHRRGLRITSPDFNPERLNTLGREWTFLHDTFKPYPSGIVTHPAIDAARALHGQITRTADIERVVAEVNPWVVELTGLRAPKDGLEIKFSATGLVALGLVQGNIGPEDFVAGLSEEASRLEQSVTLSASEGLERDAAVVTVFLRSGKELSERIAHARGSLELPLTWAELEEKFRVCTASYSRSYADSVWDRIAVGTDGPTNLFG
ncbi:MmgE/PrpD family protein [Sulfobacillus harzensis]|uniref:MmgE/PrpD family protein n=1 Tax=Sulfobacillus harzensis TaxID=2729629 RepID=A0A7Y0Q2T8_9FIRM|nr:MmgE/PrpD family protein [Sulfobacillus harzensis]NMP22231.1 MmgE/PrpD family protein [Sulfobacillus harzensis]